MNRVTRQGLVYTNKARCRNCYRCLRVCPVKAIRIHEGQAYVEPDLCLGCGTCRRECPQQAKSFRSDLEQVQALVRGSKVAVSLAPSYAAVYMEWERLRLPGVLRRLGFAWVEETALGAEQVAKATARYLSEHPGRSLICSACPAVVNYLERYQPECLDLLAPVVSPMIAHARDIKQRRGPDCRVVFIGPCVAKKMEAERPEYAGVVDAVLTFAELSQWLQQEQIHLSENEESAPDLFSAGAARYFPVAGGLAKTASLGTDLLDEQLVAVSGFEAVRATLDALKQNQQPMVLEPLFCQEGCINGPGLAEAQNIFGYKRRLLHFAGATVPGMLPSRVRSASQPGPDLHTAYRAQPVRRHFTEEAIQKVLAQTGKILPEDQLNCGACGYDSCHDKAVAVLSDMAEPEMCIPQMIRLAERRTDKIIETTPNGIVVLNHQLEIIGMNRAFQRLFQCTESLLGKPIAYLLDPVDFEKLESQAEVQIEGKVVFANYHLICHQILYPLPADRQYVGIFVNLTQEADAERQLKNLQQETIRQSQELLGHQVHMAQAMVKFLGENTAKAESLVRKLTQAAASETQNP